MKLESSVHLGVHSYLISIATPLQVCMLYDCGSEKELKEVEAHKQVRC